LTPIRGGGKEIVMPRRLRLEYPGAMYHVMNRGDHREPIFRDDLDHQRLLTTLAEVCTKTNWQVHAYCLMQNYFHLVVETPNANLVAGDALVLEQPSTRTTHFGLSFHEPTHPYPPPRRGTGRRSPLSCNAFNRTPRHGDGLTISQAPTQGGLSGGRTLPKKSCPPFSAT
jgi:hypothetical protein